MRLDESNDSLSLFISSNKLLQNWSKQHHLPSLLLLYLCFGLIHKYLKNIYNHVFRSYYDCYCSGRRRTFKLLPPASYTSEKYDSGDDTQMSANSNTVYFKKHHSNSLPVALNWTLPVVLNVLWQPYYSRKWGSMDRAVLLQTYIDIVLILVLDTLEEVKWILHFPSSFICNSKSDNGLSSFSCHRDFF